MLYNDFSAYARDQERLISVNGRKQSNALDYLEGSLLINQGSPNNWRSSFFPQSTYSRIISLVTKHGIIYSLEVAKYYDQHTETTVDKVHTCPYMTPTFYLVVNWWCQINKTPQSSFNECNFFFFWAQELELLLKGLSFLPGFVFEKDVAYVEFLNRVKSGEEKLQSQGQWDVPHPWLNLFVPKSRISDFDAGVLKGIVLKRNITTAPVLLYPMNRTK